GVIARLLGWPLSAIFLVTVIVLLLMTSTVLSASLLIQIQLPSGDAAAPWARSMPGISAMTLLVAASMMCTESPALLVWMIRTAPPEAAVSRSVNTTNASAARGMPSRVISLVM